MEVITKSTKLNKGDYILIKRKTNDFDCFSKNYVGVLRDYDNKDSLSGCITKLYINFKISGIVKEITRPIVFCWYKKSFIVLSGLDLSEDYGTNCEVSIIKLSKEEARKFVITMEDYKRYILKENICDALEDSGQVIELKE